MPLPSSYWFQSQSWLCPARATASGLSNGGNNPISKADQSPGRRETRCNRPASSLQPRPPPVCTQTEPLPPGILPATRESPASTRENETLCRPTGGGGAGAGPAAVRGGRAGPHGGRRLHVLRLWGGRQPAAAMRRWAAVPLRLAPSLAALLLGWQLISRALRSIHCHRLLLRSCFLPEGTSGYQGTICMLQGAIGPCTPSVRGWP